PLTSASSGRRPARPPSWRPLAAEQLAAEPFVREGLVEHDGRRVRVEVTAALLALLARTNVRFFEFGEGLQCETAIDPKRPYGALTCFELEMAEILSIEPAGPPQKDEPGLRELTEAQM